MVALLALLITWVVTSGGGGGKNDAGGSNGKNPASSITPGPSDSGPAISQHPGGRDESSGGDSSGAGSGSAAGGGSGAGSGDTSGSGGAGTGGVGSAGGDDGINGSAGGGIGTGTTLPAGSPLPNCTAGTVKLALSSVRNSYTPDQTPTFRIVARNTSAHDCKIDLGPKSAVVTITQDGDHFWSSADCPKGGGSLLYRVPGGSSITYVVTWDRRASAPQCATPPAKTAGPGTYLVEARAPGFEKAQTSFVLAAD